MSVARRSFAAAALTGLVLTLLAGSARGAILGSLAPASARPGEWVELTTDPGAGGPDFYADVAAAGPAPLWLQRADPNSPGNECSLRVGDLTWSDGVGHARFQVPALEPGPYWVLVTVQGACWRFGNRTGVLTLNVLSSDAGPMPALLVGIIVALGALALPAGLLIRRRSSSRSGLGHSGKIKRRG